METSQNEEENNNFFNCKSTDGLENPGHTPFSWPIDLW